LFGYEVFPLDAPAVLVESPLDVVRMHTAGLSGGLATYGAEWTDAQMRLILEVASELIIGFDNDKGGHKAAQLLLHGDKKDKRRGYIGSIRCFLANYDGIKAKDPGEMTDEQIHDWAETSRFWAVSLVENIHVPARFR
jgi:DNA primase